MISQILMTKYQRLFTNDYQLLKIYSLNSVRKNSYEIFSFLCKTNPILPTFRLKTMILQKTKPIQSQFNPKQTQFNPIQTQFPYTETGSDILLDIILINW
jgi:hypothetical protein